LGHKNVFLTLPRTLGGGALSVGPVSEPKWGITRGKGLTGAGQLCAPQHLFLCVSGLDWRAPRHRTSPSPSERCHRTSPIFFQMAALTVPDFQALLQGHGLADGIVNECTQDLLTHDVFGEVRGGLGQLLFCSQAAPLASPGALPCHAMVTMTPGNLFGLLSQVVLCSPLSHPGPH